MAFFVVVVVVVGFADDVDSRLNFDFVVAKMMTLTKVFVAAFSVELESSFAGFAAKLTMAFFVAAVVVEFADMVD